MRSLNLRRYMVSSFTAWAANPKKLPTLCCRATTKRFVSNRVPNRLSIGLLRKFSVAAIILLAAGCALLWPRPANAQLTRGTILGTITDASNAVIADARISIRNLQTGIERTTTTNDVGIYRFPAIEPGLYAVTFTAPGFQ